MDNVRQMVDVPGFGRVAYRRAGRGHPVILLHGFLGSSQYWSGQLTTLAPLFDVIAPDLPGFGDSADSPVVHSIEGFTEYIDALASALGVSRFDLVGHSMGGAVAQQYVLDRASNVRRLVLYGTSPSGVLPERFESFGESICRIQDEGVGAHADRVVPTWFAKRRAAPAYEECRRAVGALGVDAAVAAQKAIAAWDVTPRLGQIRAPTLVVVGDRDLSCSPRIAFSIWSAIAGARLFIAPGCAHAVHLENPRLFDIAVAEFLADG